MFHLVGVRYDETIYTMLPMYHMSANGIATGPVLVYGWNMVFDTNLEAYVVHVIFILGR